MRQRATGAREAELPSVPAPFYRDFPRQSNVQLVGRKEIIAPGLNLLVKKKRRVRGKQRYGMKERIHSGTFTGQHRHSCDTSTTPTPIRICCGSTETEKIIRHLVQQAISAPRKTAQNPGALGVVGLTFMILLFVAFTRV